jgi:hypothetical protein
MLGRSGLQEISHRHQSPGRVALLIGPEGMNVPLEAPEV